MAVLDESAYYEMLKRRFSGDSEDDIKDFENAVDTYTAMKQAAQKDAENWEEKFKANDEAWRKKYMARFQSGTFGEITAEGFPFDPANPGVRPTEKKEGPTAETITIGDLFSH